MPSEPQNIAMFNYSAMAAFFVDVARFCRKQSGSRIHVYCPDKEQVRFYEGKDNETFASINIAPTPEFIAFDASIDWPAELESARSWEARLGCTYNRLVVNNRQFGRGYALAGSGHPRSWRSENTNYRQVVWAYNRVFAFWDKEIDRLGLDLLLNGPNYLPLIARAKGIPFRGIIGARYQNYHYWSDNEFYHHGRMEKVFRSSDHGADAAAVALTEAYAAERAYRPVAIRGIRFSGFVRKSAEHVVRRAYYRLRGYAKGKNAYTLETVKYLYRRWRDGRIACGRNTVRLADIAGEKFVFYPLHTEPEASLGGYSPEYFYQHAAISSLSRDLPAGYLLAVKETIHGVGRRPPNFYRNVSDLKNVVWIDMFEPGVSVVAASQAVATITGTAGLEAAIMGIPVLSFGRHNNYNVLQHVMVITDEEQIAGYLRTALGGTIDRVRARKDGARLLKALVETSFDMGNFSYVTPERYDPAVVATAYAALLESLGQEIRPRVPRPLASVSG